MAQQINPPYDGSAPCPGCADGVRGVSALIHNFLTRWPEGKAFKRLSDLRRQNIPSEPPVDRPAVSELLATARALVEATEGMTEEGLQIRWSPEIRGRVAALVPRAIVASNAYRVISEAHFHDARHASGKPNVLRKSQGYSFTHFERVEGQEHPRMKGEPYNHTVEAVTADADLVHQPCGTGLKLGEIFKAELARDPTFYGKVYCPSCGIDAPFEQFKGAEPEA